MATAFVDATQAFAEATATVSIPKSASAQVGDFMEVVITRTGNQATMSTVPSQFTEIGITFSGSTITQYLYRGIVGAGDPANYDFVMASSATMFTGICGFYRGQDPDTPVDGTPQIDNEGAVSDTSIPVPGLTTTEPTDRLIAGISHAAPVSTSTTYTWPDGTYNQRAVVQGTASGKRNSVLGDKELGSVNPPGFTVDASELGVHVGSALALMPLVVPTTRYAPDSIAAQSGGAVAAVIGNLTEDPDVDTTDTDGLVPTTPASPTTGLTNGPERVDTSAAVTGFAATTLTNEANIYDGNDATAATHALGANNTDYGRWFQFNAADWSDVPANATITGFQIRARLAASSTNRLTVFFQMGTSNGNLIGSEGQADGGTALPTTVQDYGANLSPSMGVPTLAQLQSGTFGIRMRWRRSNTVTISIYTLEATVTYSTPGQTGSNTSLRVTFPTPSLPPLTGAAAQEFRARLFPVGNGPGVAQGRITLYENGVSKTTTTGLQDITSSQVLSLVWDASSLSTANGSGVEALIDTVGAEGSALGIASVEWNEAEGEVTGISLTGGHANAPAVANGGTISGTTTTLTSGHSDGIARAFGGTAAAVTQQLTSGHADARAQGGAGTLALVQTISGGHADAVAAAGAGTIERVQFVTGGHADARVQGSAGTVATVTQQLGAGHADAVAQAGAGTVAGTTTTLVGGHSDARAQGNSGTVAGTTTTLTGGHADALAQGSGGTVAAVPVALSTGHADAVARGSAGGTIEKTQFVTGGHADARAQGNGGTVAAATVTLTGGTAAAGASAAGGTLNAVTQQLGSGHADAIAIGNGGTVAAVTQTLSGGRSDARAAAGGGSLAAIPQALSGGHSDAVASGNAGVIVSGTVLTGGHADPVARANGGAVAGTTTTLTGGHADSIARGSGGVLLVGGTQISGGHADARAQANAGTVAGTTTQLSGGKASAIATANGGTVATVKNLSSGHSDARAQGNGGTVAAVPATLSGGHSDPVARANGGQVLPQGIPLSGGHVDARAQGNGGTVAAQALNLSGGHADARAAGSGGMIAQFQPISGGHSDPVARANGGTISGTTITLTGGHSNATARANGGTVTMVKLLTEGHADARSQASGGAFTITMSGGHADATGDAHAGTVTQFQPLSGGHANARLEAYGGEVAVQAVILSGGHAYAVVRAGSGEIERGVQEMIRGSMGAELPQLMVRAGVESRMIIHTGIEVVARSMMGVE